MKKNTLIFVSIQIKNLIIHFKFNVIMKNSTTKKVMLLTASVLLSGMTAFAEVNIAANETKTQNFDAIGTEATASLPTGWKMDKLSTTTTVGTYAAAVDATERQGGNSMSSTAGNGLYNFGAGDLATALDRAIGGLSSSSSSKSINVYLKLTNNGTTDITSFNISYDIEKYRMGSRVEPFGFQLYTSPDDATYTSAGDDFLTSFAGDAANAGYAEAPGDSKSVSATLTQTLAVGESLYLAWNYSVLEGTSTSNSQALALDNVSITANTSTGIAEVASATVVAASEGAVSVNAAEGTAIEVYNVAGQKIASAVATGNTESIAVNAKGIVIVKVGAETVKVVL